jgi:hypothetical protein
MNMQKNLLDLTKLIVGSINSPKIRGVEAVWKDIENTAMITFYLDGETTPEELEDFSIANSEIIAHCSNARLEENFIRLDYPKPLPKEFLAYKREGEL